PKDYRPKGVALPILRKLSKKLRDLGIKETDFKVYKFESALNYYKAIGCEQIGEHESGRYIVFRMKL
ncbi:MAG: hypothetical protein IIB81_04520, partial [Nanoarchaeota archaeon]|nr:hypothetical protein [Nanoarchaeota archaeon]